ncbi:DUF3291 domain-containing protein [Nocardiopsis changdeensis]|uniref:DUF3291 domain-containing protein n=1 Tax=Nocardiopsis changdeensis TaxID=2831969 RepID=A0ABX8BLT4_9ACTN|nr:MULTISPECIES: DUF3291 domain-containing protein [Nocardiopsis]QUX23205.1 DUF3291 domain-containing protein [Nocardiopsis changdeensis]QYX39147.1 DUF3291 domain-containing protein [Nocardiopsis sp. MT53]
MSDPRPGHQLAQFNIGRLKAPLSDPSMEGFTSQIEPVNLMAEKAPGFVWRLIEEGKEDATGLRPFGDSYLVNYSVWEDLETLWDFTYRTDHLELLRGRREWFERSEGPHLVLWWIPSGTIPSVEEAGRRLDLLREHGPSPEAFTLRTHFPPPATP